MPRAKTPGSGRLPPLQRVLPPLFLLLAGWSIPVADAAPRPTTALDSPSSSSVPTVSGLGNDIVEPCSRSRLHPEPPRRKLVQGGAAANTSCGFYDGDPARPLVPPPGVGCTTDEATRVWGFCPMRGGSMMDPGPLHRSDSVASSCKLTATCYDSFACKAGCGVAVSGGVVGGEGGSDAVDETGHAADDGDGDGDPVGQTAHAVDEGAADAVGPTAHRVEDGTADGDGDEDEDEEGGSKNYVPRHLPHISGRALPRMTCMDHEATKYCSVALWIRHDNVRFTSLTCGTAAGSTTSIFENPWTAAARTPPSATAGVSSGGVSAGTLTATPTPSLSPFPSSGPVGGPGSTGPSVTTRGRAVVTSGRPTPPSVSPIVGRISSTNADAASSRRSTSRSSSSSKPGDATGEPPPGPALSLPVAPTVQIPGLPMDPSILPTSALHISLPPADPSLVNPAAATSTSTPPPPQPTATSSSARAGNTTTQQPPDGDQPTALTEHPDERGRIAGIIVGALAGVVLVASAVLLAAYRRTRHRFGTAMQFIYHSFRSSSGSAGFGGGGEDERLRRGERKPGV